MDAPLGCDMKTMLDAMREGFQVVDRDFRYVFLNAAALRHARRKESELLGRTMMECYPEIENTELFYHLKRCRDERVSFVISNEFRYPDDSIGHFELQIVPIPIGLCVLSLDVTDRLRAERALRESEERLRLAVEGAALGTWHWDLLKDELVWSERCRAMFGISQAGEMSYERFLAALHPDDRARTDAAVQRALLQRTEYDIELRSLWPDGSVHWAGSRGRGYYDEFGQAVRMEGVAHDVTERKNAEQALRESEAGFRRMANDLQKAQTRLNTALHAAGMGTWVWEIADDRVLCDTPLLRLFGIGTSELPAFPLQTLLGFFHEDDRTSLRAALERALANGDELDVEARVKRADGSKLWLACKGRVEGDPEGRPIRFSGACVDVTQRRRLEDALRQAQKMEAIGKLAGGLAHDFNNLLTVIIGQASLMPLLGELNDKVTEAVDSIAEAAERATGLTSQLLAFGRRQLMQPQELDLNQIVADALKTVRRMVGEQIVVELSAEPRPIGVKADPSMLTQMLLNLTGNSRDAMPHGGRLRLSTRLLQLDERDPRLVPEVSAGTWACLSVSDTGIGIASDVLPHIFEPFFTTKEAGKGKGLGLATVYGLVRQHRGFMHVESDGNGSTFQLFLPLSHGVPVTRALRPSEGWPRGHGETVLLVEDDAAVRATVGQILTRHGYHVLLAEDGAHALDVWNEESDAIDLVLTDIVMPGKVRGHELAAQLSARKPSLKTILTSGYSADAIGADTPLDKMRLLKKPYAADQLLRVVREVLTHD